jgi:hypothetical protein
VPASVAAEPRPAATCENIEGTFVGQANPTPAGFDVFIIELTGPLEGQAAGTQLVWVTIQKITPGGTIHFTGTHHFDTTALGAFSTSDTGTIAPNGNVHNTLNIVDGASGVITAEGVVDLTTGLVDLDYHGRVCSA